MYLYEAALSGIPSFPLVLPHPFSISQSWLFFLKVGRFSEKLVVFPKSWSFRPTFKQALIIIQSSGHIFN